MSGFKSKEDYERWKEKSLLSEGRKEQAASQTDSMQIERTSYEEDIISKKKAAASEAARKVSDYYADETSTSQWWRSSFIITRIATYGTLFVLTVFIIYFRLNMPLSSPEEQGQPMPATLSQVRPATLAEDQGKAKAPGELPVISTPVAIEVGPAMTPEAKGKKELYDNALALVGAGDFVGAEALFRELPEGEPRVLTYRGICWFNLGDYSQTVASLEKATELDPRDFEARKVLALAYYKIDNLPQSLLHTKAALSIKNDQQLLTLRAKLERENKTQKDFVSESSDHFKIQYDGYAHGKIDREVLSLLEDAYRHVGKELDYFPTDPVTVILYTNKDFFDTTRVPSWAGGLYDGKIRLPVRGTAGSNPMLAKVLSHEYTHVVVNSLTKRCPLWLNEGLAEYLSTTYPRRTGQTIPLKYLETSFSGLRSVRDVSTAYQESWSAVSHLVERHGMYRIKGLLVALGEGADPDQAFRSSFGISYKDFLTGWGKD